MIQERWYRGDRDKAEVHLVKTFDCEPMMKALQELPEHIRYRRSSQTGMRHIFSLTPIIAVNWAKEWGVKLYSKEFAEKAKKRVMNDPNWSKLRIRL